MLDTQLVTVVDDALPPAAIEVFRAFALAQPFETVQAGPDRFHGIARLPLAYADFAREYLPPGAEPVLTFLRRSPCGQAEPNFIHTDEMMGAWTGVLYLNPNPPPGDGTIFWERIATGATQGQWDDETRRAATDLSLWTPWRTVEAQYNRLVLFRAPLFHSRALVDNYGKADDGSARLTQIIFGRWADGVPLTW